MPEHVLKKVYRKGSIAWINTRDLDYFAGEKRTQIKLKDDSILWKTKFGIWDHAYDLGIKCGVFQNDDLLKRGNVEKKMGISTVLKDDDRNNAL